MGSRKGNYTMKTIVSAFQTKRSRSRYKRREVPVFWGVAFHIIDKKLIDLLVEGIRKRFRMTPHQALKKLNGGLNEGRIRARARLRVCTKGFRLMPRGLVLICLFYV